MGSAHSQSLHALLKEVSRSFYLTLRVLPAAIRPQIGLAYLLARATDTIADTGVVPAQDRLEALRALRERILGGRTEPVTFGGLAQHQGSPGERVLLERCEEAIRNLAQLSPEDQQRVREVLRIITSGQELDVARFGEASEQNIQALQTHAELDDYTYRVAGCVGEFWTRMCCAHLFKRTRVDESFLLSNGVRFGKGLQLVNILRDLPKDLRLGRCYFPLERLRSIKTEPADLLKLETEPRFRPAYRVYLDLAEGHLAAGWAYANAVPKSCVRVRLACAWPILIGQRTLDKLRNGNVLDASRRIKVSRVEVRQIIIQTMLFYPLARRWTALFADPKSGSA